MDVIDMAVPIVIVVGGLESPDSEDEVAVPPKSLPVVRSSAVGGAGVLHR